MWLDYKVVTKGVQNSNKNGLLINLANLEYK